MKLGLGPMPWDMVVFLTLTTVGFGYSVQRVMSTSTASESSAESFALGFSGAARGTLELGCVDRKLRESVESELSAVRLKGTFCEMDAKALRRNGSVRVRNRTTGVEGTVIFRGSGASFVTDDLALRAGRNLIELEWRESRATAVRTYVAEVYEK